MSLLSDHEPAAWLPLKPEVFELLLALEGGDRHGYAMLKTMESRGVPLAASLLYRKLKRLIEDGLVEESAKRPRRGADDARRRYYQLTPLGRAVVGAEAKRIMELSRSRDVRRLAQSVEVRDA
jgi:DNA-binding PadR family transcriptional regulator